MFKKRNAKIVPSSVRTEEKILTDASETMRVISLGTLLKLYGGQRCPSLDTYENFKGRGDLRLLRYFPHGATCIYVSHEGIGSEHRDIVDVQRR